MFTVPISQPALLRAMRSSACYAELAQLAKSWEPNSIERSVFGRDWDKSDHEKIRSTFYSTRDGALIQTKHAQKICETFPNTRLAWWRIHPIGQILCDSSLKQGGVLQALEMLPAGPERALMWDERCVGLLSFERYQIEIPSDIASINSLEEIGTSDALLALIGRMRLSQLRGGETELDVAYERAIWRILPACIARTPHLYLGHRALVEALHQFLWWSPFSDSRYLHSVDDDSITELIKSVHQRLSEQISSTEWPNLSPPPKEQLDLRAKLARQISEQMRI